MDNDGTNEIIIFDGRTIELYTDRILTVVDSFEATHLPTGVQIYAIAYDIDDDNLTEVIAVGQNDPSIVIIEYNGTHLYEQIEITQSSGIDEDCIIACAATDLCLLACTNKLVASQSVQSKFGYSSFSSTAEINTSEKNSGTPSTSYDCVSHSQAPMLTLKRIDTNGSDWEAVHSYIYHKESAGASDHSSNSGYTGIHMGNAGELYDQFSAPAPNSYSDEQSFSAFTCRPNLGSYISAVTAGNLDGATGNGLEIVLAYQNSADTFKLSRYTASNTLEQTHPTTYSPDGNLISNIILMNALPESTTTDYCVFGSKISADSTLTLFCGTKNPGYWIPLIPYPDEQDFDISLSDFGGTYNISDNDQNFFRLAHAVDMSQDLVDGANLDEISISYGIFELGYDTFTGEDLDLLWYNDIGTLATIIPVDYEGVGQADLIIESATNLYYYDDGFTNTPAYIDNDYSEIDPCIDDTWKTNTTVRIRARASDIDGSDQIQARAILYYDHANKQDSNWSLPLNGEGTDFQWDFIANSSIGSGKLYVMVRDPVNNNRSFPDDLCLDPETDDGCYFAYFSVADTGTREFNDGCVTTFGTDPEDVGIGGDEGEECTTDSDCETGYFCGSDDECHTDATNPNNAVNSALEQFQGMTGLSYSMIAIIIMGILIYGLFMDRDPSTHPIILVGGAVGVVLFGVIIGVKFGVFGVGTIIILVLTVLVGAGLLVGKLLSPSGGN